MRDWRAANLQLRADRDAMDEAKRRETEARAGEPEDCICTEGHVCRHNGACPRRAGHGTAGR